jgi:hypothetical protein
MPESRPNTTPVIAMAMFVSAVTLVALAALIYMGVVPLPPEMRLLASLLVGAAAFADFLVAVWFFRKSQSS